MPSTTMLSRFVDASWHLINADRPENAAFIITSHLCGPTSGATREVRVAVQRWWMANAETINGWLDRRWRGEMTTDEFFDHVRENLLQA